MIHIKNANCPRRRQLFPSYCFSTVLKKPFNKGMACLNSDRQLIEICGPDTRRFLQSLISNDVPPLGPWKGAFTGFFLPQGRILCDAFIYSVGHSSVWKEMKGSLYDVNTEAFFIECDLRSAKNLLDHLEHYKLRSKLSLRLVNSDEWSIWSSWGIDGDENDIKVDGIGCRDARAPGMGRRDILPGNTKPAFELDEVSVEYYKLKRYLLGVPEGANDIFENIAFPIESCIDYMGGINFYKGCYIGQELTTRIYHTGVVRKRIVPISLYDPDSSPPSVLEYIPCANVDLPEKASTIVREDAKQKSVGKFCSGIGNIGLGLMRLDSVFNEREKHKKCIISYVDKHNNNRIIGVKAFQPWWWFQKYTE